MSTTVKIDSFFRKKSAASEPAPASAPIAAKATTVATVVVEEDAFYAWLSPAQRLAHTIAKEKLGTSYDSKRTHDYQRFLEKK